MRVAYQAADASHPKGAEQARREQGNFAGHFNLWQATGGESFIGRATPEKGAERFSNLLTVGDAVQGGFFLRKKPLSGCVFGVWLMENRCGRTVTILTIEWSSSFRLQCAQRATVFHRGSKIEPHRLNRHRHQG
jgi:hypothetical protein